MPSTEGPASPRAPRARAAPVRTETVVRRELSEVGRWPAELVADATVVAAGVAGRVEAMHVRVGDAVSAGDSVATLVVPGLDAELLAAQANVASRRGAEARALAQLRAARRELHRSEALARGRISSERELDDAKTRAELAAAEVKVAEGATAVALAELARVEARALEAKVVAPFDSTVSARVAEPGGWVTVGAPVARLVSRGRMWARVDVPEADLAGFRVGQEVVVVVPSSAGSEARGVVTGIAGEVTRDRRTAAVEVRLDEPPAGWRSGMFAEVVAARRRLDDAVVVPALAVLSRLGAGVDETLETGVLVVDPRDAGPVARWVPVIVGARSTDSVGVVGAHASDLVGRQVIVAGHSELPDGAPVLVVAEDGGSAAR